MFPSPPHSNAWFFGWHWTLQHPPSLTCSPSLPEDRKQNMSFSIACLLVNGQCERRTIRACLRAPVWVFSTEPEPEYRLSSIPVLSQGCISPPAPTFISPKFACGPSKATGGQSVPGLLSEASPRLSSNPMGTSCQRSARTEEIEARWPYGVHQAGHPVPKVTVSENQDRQKFQAGQERGPGH